MEHDLFRMSFIQDFLKLSSQFINRLFPGNSLPYSFSPLAYPLQRIDKAVRIIDLVDSGLTPGTQLPVGSGKLGISFYFDQSAVFNIANDAIT
jgi:hypothetical protein